MKELRTCKVEPLMREAARLIRAMQQLNCGEMPVLPDSDFQTFTPQTARERLMARFSAVRSLALQTPARSKVGAIFQLHLERDEVSDASDLIDLIGGPSDFYTNRPAGEMRANEKAARTGAVLAGAIKLLTPEDPDLVTIDEFYEAHEEHDFEMALEDMTHAA